MRKKRMLCLVLLAIAAAALWADAYVRAQALSDAYDGVGVRMADAKIPGKRLRRLLREDGDSAPVCAAAWTRGGKQAAQAPSMQTETKLIVIAVMGDVRQVTPMRLVSGGYLAEDDETGCLLDTQSAQALFRSVDVAGVSVTVGEKRYTVRGVVAGGERMALVRDASAAYENLEFTAPDRSAGKAAVEAFLYRHALSGDYTVVQGGLYARMLLGLLYLPVATGLLLLAARLLRAAVRRPVRAGVAIPLSAAAIACGAAAVITLKKNFFWPQIYLPTKCADFAFWGALTNDLQEAWTKLSLAVPLPKDMQFYRGMRACVCRLAAIFALELILCALLGGGSNADNGSETSAARREIQP